LIGILLLLLLLILLVGCSKTNEKD
jgi:hypothetical protein